MADGIIYDGYSFIEDYYTYVDGERYQISNNVPHRLQYSIGAALYYDQSALLITTPPPAPTYPDLALDDSYLSAPLEQVLHGIYRLYNSLSSFGTVNVYYGIAEFITLPASAPLPQNYHPDIRIGDDFYEWEWFVVYVSKAKLYRKTKLQYFKYPKPYHIDLVRGYPHDPRQIPPAPFITPTSTESATIGYYKWNHLESTPNLISIDWREYTIKLIKGVKFLLPLDNCVLGTLYIISNTPQLLSLLSSVATVNNCYSYSDLFPNAIPSLFAHWNNIRDTEYLVDLPTNFYFNTGSNTRTTTHIEVNRELNRLAANNNYWKNDDNIINDLHPERFALEEQTIYDRHIALQIGDQGIGNLIMDSPRIIEIHKALEADNYIINRIDNERVRVTSLAYYIQNIARVLGIRLNDDGEIDLYLEKKDYKREVVIDPTYDKRAYSLNAFGLFGRLTPHLTNVHGKKAYDKFADIPQMLEAQFEHINRSMGIQQGTELIIKNSTTGKDEYYPNQLAIQLEILSKLTEIQLNSKESFSLTTVIASEIRELFSGLGIPILIKSLYTRYGRFLSMGHQADKGSLNTSLTTLKINIGMLVGNLLIQRPTDTSNPLERIFAKPKKKP